MDLSRLTRLRQISVPAPCSEDWNSMEGNDKKRFCAGCSCYVHNIESMGAEEAESLLDTNERVCSRLIVDDQKGVLTRDGWIPRLLLAGAVAATVAGCSSDAQSDGGPMVGSVTPVKQSISIPKKSQPTTLLGDVRIAEPELGKLAVPNRNANHSSKNVGKDK